jgi:hypothetical protein
MFRTTNLNAWTITGNSFMIDDVSFLDAGSTRDFEINSHLPFLYLPDADW